MISAQTDFRLKWKLKILLLVKPTLTTNNKPGVDLIKCFWCKFTHTFCKLDCRINVAIIFLGYEKNLDFKKESEFTKKMFYEIYSRAQCYDTFYIRNLRMFIIS